jgi:heme-degrading monooxygenase HmoA
MESLAAAMPGYLGIESVRGEDGVGITISYWREPFHAQAWKEVAEHQAAQVAGRERFYEWYRVRVATVLREHGFERDVPERTGEP